MKMCQFSYKTLNLFVLRSQKKKNLFVLNLVDKWKDIGVSIFNEELMFFILEILIIT